MLGSFGPLGHLPGSGTVAAALVGIPGYWFLSDVMSAGWLVWTVIIVVFVAASVLLHTAGDRILGDKDSRILVWDEVAGYLIAVAFLPWSWQLAILAWILERGFDILKVPPANWVEQRWPGGWGVVGDDVIAGLYTRFLMGVFLWMWPGGAGVA